MSHVYTPKSVVLLEEIKSKSSAGILSKATYLLDGVKCYVKGNSVNTRGGHGHEPYSEATATIIARLLGLPHTKYVLSDKRHYPEIETFGGVEYVSVCEDYTPKGGQAQALYTILLSEYGDYREDTLLKYRQLFPLEPLYAMLTFDALIGNEDRHLGNIEILTYANGHKGLAPIFDNGGSLLALRQDNELHLAYNADAMDNSKPFKPMHMMQMKLIERQVIQPQNLSVLYENILHAIMPILLMLPSHRANAICASLKWRMIYLQRGMGL